MTSKSELENTKTIQLVDPAVTTADALTNTSVDTKGFESLTIVAMVGESGDTLSGSVKVELSLEDSPDDSTFTDCSDAEVDGSVAGATTGTFAVIDAPAEDDARYECAYLGDKRYVRPVIDLTGTHTNGIPIGILAILSNPKNGPAA